MNNFSKLAIGTAQFGMDYGISNRLGKVKKKEVFKILKLFYADGNNVLDTARLYGNSEEVIGEYIRMFPENKWSIITKVNSEPLRLKDQIKESYKKLSIRPNTVLSHSVTDYLKPNYYSQLNDLKGIGLTKKIGVSIYENDDLLKVLDYKKPDVVQLPLNILDTRLFKNGALDKLNNMGVEIHVRSVFLQGLFFLSDSKLKKYFPDAFVVLQKIKELCKLENISISQLSLLWILSLKQIKKVIIGIENVNQYLYHKETASKKINNSIFKKAISHNFNNQNVLNPSLWSII